MAHSSKKETRGTTVRLSEYTYSVLAKNATYYRCMYDGKPSLSKLLEKIGKGELQISQARNIDRGHQKGVVQVKIGLSVRGFTGSLARLVKELYEGFGANFQDISTRNNDEFIEIFFVCKLKYDTEPRSVFEAVKKLSVNDIWDVAGQEAKLKFGDEEARDTPLIKRGDGFHFSIQLSFITGMEAGILVKILEEIAKGRVHILSVSKEFSTKDYDDLHVTVMWNSATKVLLSDLRKSLSSIEGVESVRVSDVSGDVKFRKVVRL